MTFYGQEFYASYGVDWNNFDLMTLRVEGFGGCIKGVVCIDGATEFTHPKHLSFRQDDFSTPFALEEIKVPENFTEIVHQAFGDDEDKAGELLNGHNGTRHRRNLAVRQESGKRHRNLAVRQERRLEAESSYGNSTQNNTMYDYPSLKDKPKDLGIKINFKNLFPTIQLEKPLPESIMKEINEVLKDSEQEIGRIPVQFAPFQDPIGNKLLFNVDEAMALGKPLYKNVLSLKGNFPIDFPGATADYLRGSFWVDISLRLEGFVDEQFNPISSEKNVYVKMGFNIEFLDVSKMGWMHGAPGWKRIFETEMVDGQWLISRY